MRKRQRRKNRRLPLPQSRARKAAEHPRSKRDRMVALQPRRLRLARKRTTGKTSERCSRRSPRAPRRKVRRRPKRNRPLRSDPSRPSLHLHLPLRQSPPLPPPHLRHASVLAPSRARPRLRRRVCRPARAPRPSCWMGTTIRTPQLPLSCPQRLPLWLRCPCDPAPLRLLARFPPKLLCPRALRLVARALQQPQQLTSHCPLRPRSPPEPCNPLRPFHLSPQPLSAVVLVALLERPASRCCRPPHPLPPPLPQPAVPHLFPTPRSRP